MICCILSLYEAVLETHAEAPPYQYHATAVEAAQEQELRGGVMPHAGGYEPQALDHQWQEMYALVFIFRYLDLLWSYISVLWPFLALSQSVRSTTR